MEKSPDAFRTISEVADWLGVPTHVLRFWESRFTQVKPVKRAGGRRYYRPSDMELIGGIKRLLHDDGMTIRGVQKLLREKGIKHVQSLSPPLFSDVEDAELVDADATETDDRVVAFERPAPEPATPEPEEHEDTAPETPAEAGGTGTPEAATEAPIREAAEAAPEVAAEEEPQRAPVAAPETAPEPAAAEPAARDLDAGDEKDAGEPASPDAEEIVEVAEDDTSGRAPGDLFDRLSRIPEPAPSAPAPAAPASPSPARPAEDASGDDDEVDDDLLEPALSMASRLRILGDAGLAAHGAAISDVHARLIALRDRMDHRE
jgi:DNA-binding transcriptional MerR regulator